MIPALPWGWLEEAARIGLWMTPLLALMLILRPWLRRMIGGRGMALIWAVLLLRLVVPLEWVLPQEWDAEVRQVVGQKEAILGGKSPETAGKVTEMGESGWLPTTGTLLAWGWLLGAGGLMGWSLIGLVQLRRMPRREVAAAEVLAAWEGIEPRVRGCVILKSSTAISIPALVGRTIWIPEQWSLSQDQWRHILLHELGHHRRGDLWMQWLGLFVRAAYWWNPLVWLAVKAAADDREIACDEWVRRQSVEVEAYGATLINLARSIQGRAIPGAVLMATGRRQLLDRVNAMAFGEVRSFWRGGLLAASALLLALILTAQAGAQWKATPWQGGWDSPEFRADYEKKYRRESLSIQQQGTLEMQVRVFEFPETKAPIYLKKVFERDLPTEERHSPLLPLSAEEAERLLSLQATSANFPVIILSPSFPSRSQERPRMKIEIIKELPYVAEFSPKGDPLSFYRENLGISFDVDSQKEGNVYQFTLGVTASEVLGFYYFRGEKKSYQEVPWREFLPDRTTLTPPPLNEALPIFSRRIASGTAFVSEDGGAQYFLLQASEEVIAKGRLQLSGKEKARTFPDHPSRKRTYWVLVRLRPILPEKPLAP